MRSADLFGPGRFVVGRPRQLWANGHDPDPFHGISVLGGVVLWARRGSCAGDQAVCRSGIWCRPVSTGLCGRSLAGRAHHAGAARGGFRRWRPPSFTRAAHPADGVNTWDEGARQASSVWQRALGAPARPAARRVRDGDPGRTALIGESTNACSRRGGRLPAGRVRMRRRKSDAGAEFFAELTRMHDRGIRQGGVGRAPACSTGPPSPRCLLGDEGGSSPMGNFAIKYWPLACGRSLGRVCLADVVGPGKAVTSSAKQTKGGSVERKLQRARAVTAGRPAARKKPYATPVVTEYGDVAKLTQGGNGSITDGRRFGSPRKAVCTLTCRSSSTRAASSSPTEPRVEALARAIGAAVRPGRRGGRPRRRARAFSVLASGRRRARVQHRGRRIVGAGQRAGAREQHRGWRAVRARPSSYADLPERADVLVIDQIGAFGFEAGLIGTVTTLDGSAEAGGGFPGVCHALRGARRSLEASDQLDLWASRPAGSLRARAHSPSTAATVFVSSPSR